MKRKGPAVQLSATSVEHYGPPELAEAARYVLGGIDLDPASCEQANSLIRATVYYSKEEDGLSKEWAGRVYLNPPGGRIVDMGHSCNSAAVWWHKLAANWYGGEVDSALFVIFNLELLRYAQERSGKYLHPLAFPTCWPTERVDFYKPGPNGPEPQGSPGHPNAIVLLPRTQDQIDRFHSCFAPWGATFPGHATPIPLKDRTT